MGMTPYAHGAPHSQCGAVEPCPFPIAMKQHPASARRDWGRRRARRRWASSARWTRTRTRSTRRTCRARVSWSARACARSASLARPRPPRRARPARSARWVRGADVGVPRSCPRANHVQGVEHGRVWLMPLQKFWTFPQSLVCANPVSANPWQGAHATGACRLCKLGLSRSQVISAIGPMRSNEPALWIFCCAARRTESGSFRLFKNVLWTQNAGLAAAGRRGRVLLRRRAGLLAGDEFAGDLLPATGLVTSSEEYYPTVAINALMRTLRDPSMSSHHPQARRAPRARAAPSVATTQSRTLLSVAVQWVLLVVWGAWGYKAEVHAANMCFQLEQRAGLWCMRQANSEQRRSHCP